MEQPQSSQYTFIVRFWREQADDASFLWRGSVVCVQSGRREYFQTIGRLKETIQHMANDAFDETGENKSER